MLASTSMIMVNLYLENSTAPIDVAEDNARYRVLVVPETSRFGGTIVSIRMDAILYMNW